MSMKFNLMKKVLLSTVLAGATLSFANAQISQGGAPTSFSAINDKEIKQLVVSEYDIERWRIEEEEYEKNASARPYMVAKTVAQIISLENGDFVYNRDGSITWKMELYVPNAKALDVHFKDLEIPKGVRLFAYGSTKKQIMGAYDYTSNVPANFILGQIVGERYFIELEFDHADLIEKLNFDIQEISIYYRGFEEEAKAYGLNEGWFDLYADSSSPCNIDANCNVTLDGWETSQFQNAKNATARIVISGGGGMGLCSGTMVNATSNNVNECSSLFLTASHCDGSNSRDDEYFANWRFYFNYQHTECEGTQLEQHKLVQGAKFLSRSNYPSGVGNSSSTNPGLVQDFLALEITGDMSASYGITRVGWNRNMDIADINQDFDSEEHEVFVGFHHPGGNPKKQSWANLIYGNGTFNQMTEPATHWSMNFVKGCTEGGSSGSGLFDYKGRIVGFLSGGSGNTNALYSKLSYGWENTWEQGKFPPHTGAVSRLKEWFDPAETGYLTYYGTEADCHYLNVEEINIDNAFSLYPNPVNNQNKLNVSFNLPENAKVKLTIVDILGKELQSREINAHAHGKLELDITSYKAGLYFLTLESSGKKSTKKFVIN